MRFLSTVLPSSHEILPALSSADRSLWTYRSELSHVCDYSCRFTYVSTTGRQKSEGQFDLNYTLCAVRPGYTASEERHKLACEVSQHMRKYRSKESRLKSRGTVRKNIIEPVQTLRSALSVFVSDFREFLRVWKFRD